MRLENVTAEIRPRSDWEAVDLGFALARRDFWRCFMVWWLAVMVPVAVAGWWLWDAPVLWLFLCWWWKPAASRMVLYELSRRLFGQKPRWSETLRRIPRAWTRRFLHRFIFGRLSPWLPVTLAVEELEGLQGGAHRQRRRQLARRGEGAVIWVYLAAELAAAWFGMAILMLVWMFIPEGQDGVWVGAIESWNPSNPADIPLPLLRLVALCTMLSMSLTDVFVTGAGFGIYLNNRTWLEGWDVELAFRRLAARLGGAALFSMILALMCVPNFVFAVGDEHAAEMIREVLAAEEFKVHKVTDRIPKQRQSASWELTGSGELILRAAELMTYLIAAALIAWIMWLLWKKRGEMHGWGVRKTTPPPKARVVLGMEVSPETLPADIPGAALALWRQGACQEALGLLYRGAISRVIECASVEIRESDTEGDCLRRVEQVGGVARPDYFRGITGAWMRMAYARLAPDEAEIVSLCGRWPYAERRDA